MDKVTLDRFIEIYQSLNKNNLQLLDDIYHPSIQFIDPLHTVNGLESLHHYFENLYANVLSCQFSIKDTASSNNKAFIYWTMHYRHPKLNKTARVCPLSYDGYIQDYSHDNFFIYVDRGDLF